MHIAHTLAAVDPDFIAFYESEAYTFLRRMFHESVNSFLAKAGLAELVQEHRQERDFMCWASLAMGGSQHMR
jgi:hypothetical protein